MKTTTICSTINTDKTLTIASFHDVHLGHHNTLIPDVIRGFDPFLNDHVLLEKLDYIFIPGDLFDRQLTLTNQYIKDIFDWAFRFLSTCKRYKIAVRLLLGTPGHDFNQNELIMNINEKFNIQADIKYYDKLAIEYIEKDDIHLLYVPDEWSIDPMDTYQQTLDLFKQHGIDQVDFCLFHGAFGYQIDASLNPKAHDETLWNKLVRRVLFAGHVHVQSQYERIFVAGSFDRLCHGEEQPKGYLIYHLEKDREWMEFIENTNATKYVTIDIRQRSLEEIIALLDKAIPQYPHRSHIRLHLERSDALQDGLKTIRQRYKFYYFTTKIDEIKNKVKPQLNLVTKQFNAIDLTRESLVRILMERVTGNHDKEKVLSLLNQYL